MKTKLTPKQQETLDWARKTGQTFGIRMMRGELKPEEVPMNIWLAVNMNHGSFIVSILEAKAWLTDSMGVDFRVAMNRFVLTEQGFR